MTIISRRSEAIKQALASFRTPPMRMQMLKVNGLRLVNDCYNANPQSLGCALDFLAAYPGTGKKIVVCGDMLELGKEAWRFHSKLGKRLVKQKIDCLITVGRLSRHLAKSARLAGMPAGAIRSCSNTTQAAKTLRRVASSGDIILLKGSRAAKLENIAQCFTSSSTR